MKVLMILESEFPHDIRVENEIEQLLKLGYDVSIACFTQRNQPLFEELNNVKIFRKKISSLIHKSSVGILKFPFYFNFWKRYLREVLQNNLFDLIHIHDLPLTKVGIAIKHEFNIPILIDLHENWPALIADAKHTNTFLGKLLSSNKQWVEYEKAILKKADTIITVVDEMKNRIVDLGINDKNIFVVSNVLNLTTFPSNNVKIPEGINLFYGGGLTFHRGLQVAIEGVALLKDKYPDISLIIAGDGSYKNELKALSIKLNIEKNIVFLGRMSQNDLLIETKKCSIALIPHLKSVQTDNSSPNKLFQYMYAEKPILSSNCNSLKRVIEMNNVGVVYSDKDPIDFANKLVYLLENNKNNIFGINGKKAVLNKYNWSKNKLVLQEAYKNALTKKQLNLELKILSNKTSNTILLHLLKERK